MHRRAEPGPPVTHRGPSDAFGDRVIVCQPDGRCLETLTVTGVLAREPAFGQAVARRARLLEDRPVRGLARVFGVEMPAPGEPLRIHGEWVAGERLGSLVSRRSREGRPLTPAHMLFVARQAVATLRGLHGVAAGACHGALTPATVVVAEDRVLLTHAALGAGLVAVGWSGDTARERLGVLVPPLPDIPAFTPLTDQVQLGYLLLGMLVGDLTDPVPPDPGALRALLDRAHEHGTDGSARPLGGDLRHLLERMLLLSPEGPFRSFTALDRALDALVAVHPDYAPSPPAIVAEAMPEARVFLTAEGHGATDEDLEASPAEMPFAGPGSGREAIGRSDRVAPLEPLVAGTGPPVPAWWHPVAQVHGEDGVQTQDPRIAGSQAGSSDGVAGPFEVCAGWPVAAGQEPSHRPERLLGASPGMASPGAATEAAALAVPGTEPSAAAQNPSGDVVAVAPGVPSGGRLAGDPRPGAGRRRHVGDIFGLEWSDEEGSAAGDSVLVASDGTVDRGTAGTRRQGLLRRNVLVGLTVAAAVVGAIWAWRLFGGPLSPLTRPAHGFLRLESKPAGASVFVNGELKGTTPLIVSVPPGSHRVDFEREGETRSLTVPVVADQEAVQIVSLYPPGPPGRISVGSVPPGALVSLNGEPRGRTPLTLEDVVPGEHAVVVESGLTRIQRTVEILPGAAVDLMLPISGSIEVQAPFEITVYDRQRMLGSTRAGRVTVPAGRRSLTFVNEALNFEETREVEVTAGSVARVVLTPPTSTLNFSADVTAEVFLDGRPLGPTPLTNIPVSLGSHEVLFRHPRWGEVRYTIFVTVGPPARLHATLQGTQRGVTRNAAPARRR